MSVPGDDQGYRPKFNLHLGMRLNPRVTPRRADPARRIESWPFAYGEGAHPPLVENADPRQLSPLQQIRVRHTFADPS
jgi:hypothetical protein